MALPFFTIGHSNRPLEVFVDLLKDAGIELVADIRKVPGSRANPQFNGDAMATDLASSGMAYEHMAALGGLRGKGRSLPPAVNGLWENRSFHNYADYALSDEFQAGLEHLREGGTGSVARSCVRKPCGGGVIAGSSRTISSPTARRFTTSWNVAASSPPG